MIGKPCARNSHARFDDGELEIGQKPLRQLSTLPSFLRRQNFGKEGVKGKYRR
jgi:hypothetical protein